MFGREKTGEIAGRRTWVFSHVEADHEATDVAKG